MKNYFNYVAIFLLIGINSYAETFALKQSSTSLPVAASLVPSEVFIRIQSKIKCNEGGSKVTLKVHFQKRDILVDLFENKLETRVSLGRSLPSDSLVTFYALSSSSCVIDAIGGQIEKIPLNKTIRFDAFKREEKVIAENHQLNFYSLVVEHSPFLTEASEDYRKTFKTSANQIPNTIPLPLYLSYAFRVDEKTKNLVLTYIYFYSHQGLQSSKKSIQSALSTEGTLIQAVWSYEVHFAPKSYAVLKRIIHSQNNRFEPNSSSFPSPKDEPSYYLPNSNHPILFRNLETNAIFKPSEKKNAYTEPLNGRHYLPTPKDNIQRPLSSYLLIFESHPWMFWVTEQYLKQNQFLPDTFHSEEYLYVLVDGRITPIPYTGIETILREEARLRVNLEYQNANNEKVTISSADPYNGIVQFGENLWKRQSFTALKVGERQLQRLEQGTLNAQLSLSIGVNPNGSFTLLSPLRFFYLKKERNGFRTLSASRYFDCKCIEEEVFCITVSSH